MAVVPIPIIIPASTRALPTKKRGQRRGFGAAGVEVSVVLLETATYHGCRPLAKKVKGAPFRGNVGTVKKCEAAFAVARMKRSEMRGSPRIALRSVRATTVPPARA